MAEAHIRLCPLGTLSTEVAGSGSMKPGNGALMPMLRVLLERHLMTLLAQSGVDARQTGWFRPALSLAILAAATVLTAAPAPAQTYSPDYPVCLQVYGRAGGYIACGYTSLAQCAQSASGRAAQCIINPYFVPAEPPYRRHRRPY